jgi:non-heme chloroperoxidase
MQPRTLLLKHIVLVAVAAMFFVASPLFAQQKDPSSSEMKTKEKQLMALHFHYIERGQGTPVVLVHGTLWTTARGMGSLRPFRRDIN